MPLRRLAAGALCALALLTAAPAASAGAPPSPPSSPAEPVDGYRVPPAGEDRLTILVRDGGGDRILEGAYSLDCHPPGAPIPGRGPRASGWTNSPGTAGTPSRPSRRAPTAP